MANQGSGVVNTTIDPAMHSRESTSPIDPRNGAAKSPQKSFPTKWGMKDMTSASGLYGISPANPGSGPDASSPNPLSPEPGMKELHRQPGQLQPKWGMRDADGRSVNGVLDQLSAAVLHEASRLGR